MTVDPADRTINSELTVPGVPDSSIRVVVLHHVNGATKIAEFTAPRISSQTIPGGINLDLFDADGHRIGFAQFTNGGLVALEGEAIVQYEPLHRTQPGEGHAA